MSGWLPSRRRITTAPVHGSSGRTANRAPHGLRGSSVATPVRRIGGTALAPLLSSRRLPDSDRQPAIAVLPPARSGIVDIAALAGAGNDQPRQPVVRFTRAVVRFTRHRHPMRRIWRGACRPAIWSAGEPDRPSAVAAVPLADAAAGGCAVVRAGARDAVRAQPIDVA